MNSQTHFERLIDASRLKPGEPQRVVCQHGPLLICRVSDGVYAVDDKCTHDDVSLSLGTICEHRLRCPLHGAEFDVRTGEVLEEPAEINLKTYPVQELDGWIVLLGS